MRKNNLRIFLKKRNGEHGQAMMESIFSVMVLSFSMFMMMMLAMMALGIISGFDAVHSAARSMVTYEGYWYLTTPATTLNNAGVETTHIRPLLNQTQPHPYQILNKGMNDSNTEYMYDQTSPTDPDDQYPNDRSGYLNPAANWDRRRVRAFDVQIRIRMPYLIFLTYVSGQGLQGLSGQTFDIVTDMQMVRSKDRGGGGSPSGDGDVGGVSGRANHLKRAYPTAPAW